MGEKRREVRVLGTIKKGKGQGEQRERWKAAAVCIMTAASADAARGWVATDCGRMLRSSSAGQAPAGAGAAA
mgnify:CR=1 FL=1